MGWRMLSRSLGFISMLILARLLVPADFGIVAVAASISGSIDALSQLGVRDALVRLNDERLEYYNTAFTLQVVRGLLTGLVLAGVSIFANTWFGDPRLKIILELMAGLAVVSGFENIGIVRLSRELNFRMQFIIQIAPRLLGFVVTVTLAFLLRDYRALVWGMIVSRVTSVIMTYLVSVHRPRFGMSGWRYLLGFSFWTWAGSLAMVAWSRSDPFLLGPALGPSVFGIYLLAGEIALLPNSELLEPICSALFPGFAFAQRQGKSPISVGLTVSGALALCAIPFSIGVSACSGYLVVGLLGEKWEAAQPVVAILAWICMFSPFSYVCSSLLSVQGQVRRVFFSNGTAAVVKVLVVLVVRESHDLETIATAAVLVVALESLLFIGQLRAVGNAELRQLSMTMFRAALAVIPTVCSLAIIPGTWENVTSGQFFSIIFGTGIGVLSFILFMTFDTTIWVLFGMPDGSERRMYDAVRTIINRNVNKKMNNKGPELFL
jgi:O-antigen/teichoic acid export membrane protein